MKASIDYVQFAKDFHNERWGRGLSQAQIAKELDISKSTVSRWENANTVISAQKLLAVCYYFDLNPYKYLVVELNTKVQRKIHTYTDQIMQEVYDPITIKAWAPLPGDDPKETAEQAAEHMTYAEWRNAGFGSQGMPSPDEWQNEVGAYSERHFEAIDRAEWDTIRNNDHD